MTRRFRDAANWSGIDLVSVFPGAGGVHGDDYDAMRFDGYQYASPEERMLAELLVAAEVPFTPDVPFPLGRRNGRPRTFTPDFVFNMTAWKWRGQPLHANGGVKSVLIHGIEAKGVNAHGQFSERARQDVHALWHQRRIGILLLANSDIRRYHAAGALPMVPLVT